MKKVLFFLCLFIFSQLLSKDLMFECEDGSSYKIQSDLNKLKKAFFKNKEGGWKVIEKFTIKNNKIEFFIPNLTYLPCSDKSLPICFYSKVISEYKDSKISKLSDLVQNDCYIGTMGCNLYQKGLSLNQKYCSVIKY